jgi:DNA mismatch repair protein MutH
MSKRNYDPASAASIFGFSKGLLHKTLAQAVAAIDPAIDPKDIELKGKGELGNLVEKFYYDYEPNSDPRPDFPQAGVELKTTPLKLSRKDEYLIKERLVCDMIDYCAVVKCSFEDSLFYKKCLLMLIIFYLHSKGKDARDLEFVYSVLWQFKDKDLMIIKQDYEVIIDKIKAGKADEISEGDTMYLGACRKGQKGDSLRKQPFSEVGAPKRAFSLKCAYMRTILSFVQESGKDMATNTDIKAEPFVELVSAKDLQSHTFEEILTARLMAFMGQDYRQIASHFEMPVSPKEKSRYARVTKRILLKGLRNFEDAEEIRKAGIIAKTIRVNIDGSINESMSFENINYNEVFENDEWTESRWYEIVTSRFMFVVFAEVPKPASGWEDENRYVLDNVVFWTMPKNDMAEAEAYWQNIRSNVLADTLQDDNNTFWKMSDGKDFHVRPKAQKGEDRYYSPISGEEVPRKCYWFDGKYVAAILRKAYGEEWSNKFVGEQ